MLNVRLAALLCVVVLGGCASAPVLYGNFLERSSRQAQSFLALDAATQLRRAYSPASMPLAVPDARDPFGHALVSRLRRMGFAVSEPGAAASATALTVHYVVDALGPQLVRVSLVIERSRDQALLSRMSRAYGQRGEVMHPAGAWTRQASHDEEGQTWTTN